MQRSGWMAAVGITIAAGFSTPVRAYLPSIGVYFDPTCATCSANVGVGTPIEIYVNAQLGGWIEPGLSGAEFRVTGMPADWWILDVTPNPAANLVLGNPLALGCNIAFPDCRSRPGGCINLYVIRVLPISEPSNVRLDVSRHLSPSGCHGFCCPLVTGCDAPVYTKVCAAGGQAWINGPSCTVGVARSTWSNVKALYGAAAPPLATRD
jgi:hypothetical protein